MFDTEHTGALLTSPSESASLRRDTGECHDRLYSNSLTVIPPGSSLRRLEVFARVATHDLLRRS
jgi:hypothetical protein